MAPPVSRRPATRNNISSTQEESEYPPLQLEGEGEHHVLTQVEDFGLVNVSFSTNEEEYRPQLDNPSSLLPGDPNDIDTALEEYMKSQQDNDFILDDADDSSDDEDEEQGTVANNAPTYTQGTLAAASVLAGGFFHDLTEGPSSQKPSAEDEEELEEEGEEQVQDTPLASSIAAQLRTHGLTGTGLTVEEVAFVDECDEGKNKKAHDDSQIRYEKRFFDTIAKFGGDILSPLATDKSPNIHDQQEHNRTDHSFYSVCGGEKTADKHHIMNKCLVLCAMKWSCLSGKNKGKRIQPNSFCKMMQCLTYLMNRKGIQYQFDADFNSKGDFHGVIKKIWREERKKDPTFGTGANRARVDKSLVRKFIQAIRDKKIRPYEDPEHLLICVIFILGYYCGLRGSSEHIDLDSEMVYLGEYTVEDGPELAGLKWGGVKVPFSKTNQLNMSNTRLPVDEDVLLTFGEQPEHDCFDPYAIFCFYIGHCHPKAKKFYGRIVKQGPKKEGERLQKEFGRPVWYAESGHGRANWNLGSTKHRELCKMIAKYSEVAKWEQCTGHALRALCITHCIASKMSAVDVACKVRHASLNSQKDYATDCNERKANRILAMENEPSVADKKRSPEVASLPIPENGVIVQTQPMLPQNRDQFIHASKKRRTDTAVEENKENSMVSFSNQESELEQLKKQNEILRLRQENKRIQEELTGGGNRLGDYSPVPRRHGRSFPPSHHRPSPPSDRYHYPPPRDDGYRRSYPPTNHFFPYPPRPQCDDPRRGGDGYDYHGRYNRDEYDPYYGEYHRR